MAAAELAIEPAGPARLRVSGQLVFPTAAQALRRGLDLLPSSGPCAVDLAGVTEGDSAGLAVLIEWLAVARARDAALTFENVPPQMLAIARICDVDELLVAPAPA